MIAEMKLKEELGNSLKNFASLLSGLRELSKYKCPLKYNIGLIANSLQDELDNMLKINGNDKPTH